jgi:hypothetical protein
VDTVSIPQWTTQGVLSPINPVAPAQTDRSPYLVTLTDLVLRYTTSKDRIQILRGFLEFRTKLHSALLDKGFQWIDGSFLEHIEMVEGRPPRDIDVVTFFHLPNGQTQADMVNKFPRLFNPTFTKADYSVDGYFVQLNVDKPESLVAQSTYWYSLWSHRCNGQWKGYLQIDLSSADDQVAQVNLERIMNSGGQP